MDRIKRAMPFIITCIMVLTVFVIQFTVIGTREVGVQFWVNLGINAAIIVSTSLTWMASGTERAKNNDVSYDTNSKRYASKLKEIESNGQYGALSEFCAQKTQELVDDRIKAILARVCIDRAKYDELSGLTVPQLKEAGYTRKQIQSIERVRNGGRFPERLRRNSLRVKPIRALELTTNNRVKNPYDVLYNEDADRALSVAIRVLKSAVTGAAIAYVSFDLASNIWNMAAWGTFMMKISTVVFAAWSSEREGYAQIAEHKNRVILRRLSFLTLFEEWVRTPLLASRHE